MTNIRYEGQWGGTAGLVVQRDFTDWLGLRVELNWVQKNHRKEQQIYETLINLSSFNNYILLPIMASVHPFKWRKWSAFVNLGGFGGYWFSKKQRDITMFTYPGKTSVERSYDTEFCSDRDNRYNWGLVGGLGVGYELGNVTLQIEPRLYYSLNSSVKSYMEYVHDYRYDTTLALQFTCMLNL